MSVFFVDQKLFIHSDLYHPNVSRNHRLHRYTEVSCLQLIWLRRKWQILKENLF
jgi:hypothetical protein